MKYWVPKGAKDNPALLFQMRLDFQFPWMCTIFLDKKTINYYYLLVILAKLMLSSNKKIIHLR